jgi:hypothetical protein
MGKVDRKQERIARLRLYEAPGKSTKFIAADALPFLVQRSMWIVR